MVSKDMINGYDEGAFSYYGPEGVKAIHTIFAYLDTQLPFPYVHFICWLTKVSRAYTQIRASTDTVALALAGARRHTQRYAHSTLPPRILVGLQSFILVPHYMRSSGEETFSRFAGSLRTPRTLTNLHAVASVQPGREGVGVWGFFFFFFFFFGGGGGCMCK